MNGSEGLFVAAIGPAGAGQAPVREPNSSRGHCRIVPEAAAETYVFLAVAERLNRGEAEAECLPLLYFPVEAAVRRINTIASSRVACPSGSNSPPDLP